tara:strand:- start:6280 stop:6660 length:381 start_codon:yes stop_codon:yes gene_type:complete
MNNIDEPSQRQIRFSEVIRRIISENINIINIFDNEEELKSVTVSFVKVSKDLKVASVYIMPLGGKNKEKILEVFNENKFLFQKAISNEKLKVKYTPKIKFYLDDTFDEAQKIQKLLSNEKVLRDLK